MKFQLYRFAFELRSALILSTWQFVAVAMYNTFGTTYSNNKIVYKQIGRAVSPNVSFSLSGNARSLCLPLWLASRVCVSVFSDLHVVRCRSVPHQRISHQQAAIVLARSCIRKKIQSQSQAFGMLRKAFHFGLFVYWQVHCSSVSNF